MHQSTGRFVVHPRDRKTWPQPMWVVIHPDDEDLGRYYYEQTKLGTRAWYQVQQPAWKAHISVIRAEIETSPSAEYLFDGEAVEFEYENFVYQAGGHFCMNVRCAAVERIRGMMGLSPLPEIPLHLTVAVVAQPSPHYRFWTLDRAGENGFL